MSNNVHVNPNFRVAAGSVDPAMNAPAFSSASSVHINPNFKRTASPTTVHVNPNFAPKAPAAAAAAPIASGPSPHINPNFNRPLPPVPGDSSVKAPHVNPAFIKPAVAIDVAKQKEYDDAVVKKASEAIAQNKVFVNPKFGNSKTTFVDPSRKKVVKKNAAADSPNSSEKENSPGGPSASNRRTVFKKIGRRKLVRVDNKKGQQQHPKKKMVTATTEVVQPSRSTPFRKIGTRKLIRLQSRHKSPKKTTPNHLVYKVKSSRVHAATTPRNSPSAKRGFLMSRLVTPLSLRRKRSSPSPRLSKSHNAYLFHKVLNPFKVDRRPKKQRTEAKEDVIKQPQAAVPTRAESPRQPVQVLQTPKSVPPPKPARRHTPATQPKQSGSAVVNIDGVKFKVSDNGRKLNRMELTPSVVPPRGAPVRCSISRKLYVEGEEYVEDEDDPGTLVRSRNSMTRASITNARNRSINTILKSQTRSKQYCMFFNKFGKCNKREKGVCPYIHDREKVAVCRKFLASNCYNERCLLSHKVAPEKMPSCKFFLEGLCTKGDDCPYRHVKVNESADVCPHFLKGFCPAAAECKKRHVNVCPHFESRGACPRGEKCPLPHNAKKPAEAQAAAPMSTGRKAAPPAKPKRKSMGDAATGKKQRTARYYEEDHIREEEEEEETPKKASTDGELVRDIVMENASCSSSSASSLAAEAMEAKRKRLMRKVELAKQGWTGVAAVTEPSQGQSCQGDSKAEADGDELDTTPYEEIDEDEEENAADGTVLRRPPLGELPSFIPLSRDSDDGDEDGGGGGGAEVSGAGSLSVTKDDGVPAAKEEEFDERLI